MTPAKLPSPNQGNKYNTVWSKTCETPRETNKKAKDPRKAHENTHSDPHPCEKPTKTTPQVGKPAKLLCFSQAPQPMKRAIPTSPPQSQKPKRQPHKPLTKSPTPINSPQESHKSRSPQCKVKITI